MGRDEWHVTFSIFFVLFLGLRFLVAVHVAEATVLVFDGRPGGPKNNILRTVLPLPLQLYPTRKKTRIYIATSSDSWVKKVYYCTSTQYPFS